MGCGQSKIGNIYPKNKKNKGSVKKNDESISEFTISITFFFQGTFYVCNTSFFDFLYGLKAKPDFSLSILIEFHCNIFFCICFHWYYCRLKNKTYKLDLKSDCNNGTFNAWLNLINWILVNWIIQPVSFTMAIESTFEKLEHHRVLHQKRKCDIVIFVKMQSC